VWDVEARACYGAAFDMCGYSQAAPVIEILCIEGKETILEAGLEFKGSIIKEKQID
jgi:hypothetical protein